MRNVVVGRITVRVSGVSRASASRLGAAVARAAGAALADAERSRSAIRVSVPRREATPAKIAERVGAALRRR